MSALPVALASQTSILEGSIKALEGPDGEIEWTSEEWTISDGKRLNFMGFKELSTINVDPYTDLGVSTNDLAKLLMVELLKTGKTVAHFKQKLLLCLFTFLDQNKAALLDKRMLDNVVALFLGTNLVNGYLTKSVKVSSFERATLARILTEINGILARYDLPKLIHPSIRPAHVDKAIKRAFDKLSFDDLSYSEWKAGGSWDTLSLDMGRFYSHYNLQFFEENLATAVALRHTYSLAGKLVESVGFTAGKSTNRFVAAILGGDHFLERSSWQNFNEAKLLKLSELVSETYRSKYDETARQHHLQSETTMRAIAEILGLGSKQDDLDRLGFVLSQMSIGVEEEKLNGLLRGFRIAIDAGALRKAINIELQKVPRAKLPTTGFYEQLGFYENDTTSTSQPPFRRFVRSVSAAGLTACIALTGWRGSEYGFPAGALREQVNDDAIDQYVAPTRYSVFWHVFKTAKGTLQEREITMKARQSMHNLKLLVDSPEDHPMLFISSAPIDQRSGRNAHQNTYRAVGQNWARFVMLYEPFSVLRMGKELLEAGGEGARRAANDFDWSRYDSLVNSRLIYQNWLRATKELPTVMLHLDKQGRNWVEEYWCHLRGAPNKLKCEEISEIESRIPEHMRQFLASADKINGTLSQQFSAALLEDCLYPSPHAFRHMWAEAVYRRFDGDAGWMIRSNFKHISKRMWLAYIRNKGNRRELDLIKTRVCSGLVKAWLREEGRGFTGKFHKYLSRLITSTRIASNEELASVLDEVVTRDIISVNANPWGYCLVRRSTEKLSRCAVDGSSKTENATPSLCMSCINFLAAEGNIDYIIFSSYEHMELLKSEYLEDVPAEFVEASRDYIKQASARIKELDPSHQILSTYNAALGIISTRQIT